MTNSSKGPSTNSKGDDAAVNLIRQKVDNLYAHEPNAKSEAKEVANLQHTPSKHQAYMQKISQSGMSLAQIQTAWHNYYVNLSDAEKHEVWQEFYAEHEKRQAKPDEKPEPAKKESKDLEKPKDSAKKAAKTASKPPVHQLSHNSQAQKKRSAKATGAKTISEVKKQLTSKATLSAQAKRRAKQHFQSMLFGVGMGLVVVLILLFGFFNDRFIAPFITPSKNISSTPIIIDSSASVGSEPKIIIPKINVDIPVVYDELSIEEQAVQNALERGVVHYATTPDPGQIGNAVIFGHSSNNILNKGKYKFAFVLLNRLEEGDTFYLTKNGVRYAYRIYLKKIVPPTDVSVLNATEKKATATLITCDPPGTTINRLIVVGEQISPDPDSNTASTAIAPDTKATTLPSNAPSLWQRVRNWF